ncbi:hypothetical protein D3093_33140 (plasmid) [Azospirillum argentinense]|uniref:Peptidase S8/S53 domain-containing protein n=2 Tax=Azospirillum argentinense TaxID=2970906 RepID=A0A4D8PNK8_9PROT|nr:hypothetical protein D3093_33140 [Azospirillum argentinense]
MEEIFMARHQVRVLATSDEAAELAQQRLATRGAVDCVGAFKLGWADDADVQDLEAVGCVVELIPPDPKLGWLEPGEQPVSLPADALSDEGRSPVLASLAGTSPDYYVVQFAGPLHPQWCEQVQKLGIKIGQSVPGFANKMALTPQQKEELELLPFVRRVVEFDRAHTLRRLAYAPPRSSPVPLVERPMQRLARRIIVQSLNALGATWIGRSLGVDRILPTAPSAGAESALGAARPTESARADEGLTFDVKCHNAADLPIIAEALKQEPRVGRVDLGRNRLRFQVKNVSAMDQLLVELAELPQVSVIERYQIPQITVSFVREVLGLQMGGPPLSANGEVIGIADTGVDAEHPDLRNHILDVTYWAKPDNHRDPVGHGTHVAGIVCGDGMASNGGLIGVAPDAKIFVQALADSGGELSGVPVDLNKLFQEAYDVGARIHNNSWGSWSRASTPSTPTRSISLPTSTQTSSSLSQQAMPASKGLRIRTAGST